MPSLKTWFEMQLVWWVELEDTKSVYVVQVMRTV